jgi:hypothetical protein
MTDPDLDPGGPKTYGSHGSGAGSGSGTLVAPRARIYSLEYLNPWQLCPTLKNLVDTRMNINRKHSTNANEYKRCMGSQSPLPIDAAFWWIFYLLILNQV